MVRILLAFLALSLTLPAAAADSANPVRIGERAPNVLVEGLLDQVDYENLGLSAKGPFNLEDIEGEILILELFNRFCFSCWKQAPLLEALWNELEGRGLRGRVRVLSLGQGNRESGLRQFRSEHKLTYPVGPDPKFSAMYDFGDVGAAPLTFFLKKHDGGWTVADYHIGVMDEAAMLVQVNLLLEGRSAPMVAAKGEPLGHRPEPPMITSGAQLDHAAKLFAKVLGRTVEARALEVEGGVTLFQAVDPDEGPLDLYARITRRRPVCDLCHTTVFIFAFDGSAKVLGYQSIYATKMGNESWDEEDETGFSSRLVGRSMENPAFDSEVDAVTGATMSSALIYDEVRRTTALLGELK